MQHHHQEIQELKELLPDPRNDKPLTKSLLWDTARWFGLQLWLLAAGDQVGLPAGVLSL